MVDGDNEDRKLRENERLSLPQETDIDFDIVFGEAEYPYWDVIGIEDRWLPTKKSFEKALSGRFDACMVRFNNVGHLLVPWSKRKFKEELLKFADAYESARPKKEPRLINIKTITEEEAKRIIGDE